MTPSTRYRPLQPEEVQPARYLRGMDPDDPLPTPEELLRRKRRQDRPRLLLIAAAVLMLLALAMIAMAAGWPAVSDESMHKAALAALEAIAGAGSIKGRMKARDLRIGRCACPNCKAAGVCVASLNGPRDHLHMKCTACGWGMME